MPKQLGSMLLSVTGCLDLWTFDIWGVMKCFKLGCCATLIYCALTFLRIEQKLQNRNFYYVVNSTDLKTFTLRNEIGMVSGRDVLDTKSYFSFNYTW